MSAELTFLGRSLEIMNRILCCAWSTFREAVNNSQGIWLIREWLPQDAASRRVTIMLADGAFHSPVAGWQASLPGIRHGVEWPEMPVPFPTGADHRE